MARQPTKAPAQAEQPVTFETIRELVNAFPGVTEGTSYGRRAYRVRGKLIAQLGDADDWIMIHVDLDVRDAIVDANPEAFFVTEHLRNYPAMMVLLPRVSKPELRELLEAAWRHGAGKRLAAAYDQES